MLLIRDVRLLNICIFSLLLLPLLGCNAAVMFLGGVGQKNSLHGIYLRMQIQKVMDMYYLRHLHTRCTTGKI